MAKGKPKVEMEKGDRRAPGNSMMGFDFEDVYEDDHEDEDPSLSEMWDLSEKNQYTFDFMHDCGFGGHWGY